VPGDGHWSVVHPTTQVVSVADVQVWTRLLHPVAHEGVHSIFRTVAVLRSQSAHPPHWLEQNVTHWPYWGLDPFLHTMG
jgi:hypothetical protein